jgi:hypothetical protein
MTSDLESTLCAALRAEADRTTEDLDEVVSLRWLAFRLDRVDLELRRRRSRTVTAILVAAAVAIAVVVAVGRAHHRAPDPSNRQRPTVQGGLMISPHPYLPPWFVSSWHLNRQLHARMAPLTTCVPDPRSWGARYVQGTTYIDFNAYPHLDSPDTRVDEWLLQYPDASSAHRVLVDTLQQLETCPRPHDAVDHRIGIDRNADWSWDFDEAFGSQRTRYATPSHRGRPVSVYAMRIARARNVLVVLEDRGITTDRTFFALTTAVGAAVPHFRMTSCYCGPCC